MKISIKSPLLICVLAFAISSVVFGTIDSFLYLVGDLFIFPGGRAPIWVGFLYVSVVAAMALYIYSVVSNKNRYDNSIDYVAKNNEGDIQFVHIQVANNLNLRIRILESRSLLIYWSMISVIVSGVLLILFSGYLSSMDSYATNLWSLVEQGNPLAAPRFTSPALQEPAQETLTDAQKAQFQSYLSAREKLTTVMTGVLQSRTDDGKSFNVGSTILRVSILGMLIFLVQILMQLYRYNSRLITFYGSRRDAIMLSGGNDKSMQAFSQLLLPTGFDFGKDLNHPFAEAAQALREGTTNLKATITRKSRSSKAVVTENSPLSHETEKSNIII